MVVEVELAGRRARVEVTIHPDGGWWIQVDDGPRRRVEGGPIGAAEWRLVRDDRTTVVGAHVQGEVAAAQVAGHGLVGTAVDPRDHALDAIGSQAEGAVATPMPGAIVRVPVSVGESVEVGRVLVVVEAMKMENEFKAPVAGVVAEIHVTAGETVDAGAMLVRIETGEGA